MKMYLSSGVYSTIATAAVAFIAGRVVAVYVAAVDIFEHHHGYYSPHTQQEEVARLLQ